MLTVDRVTAEEIGRVDLVNDQGRSVAVTAMAVDPGRGLIVVGTDDNHLQWIDAASMQTIGRTRAHRDRIRSVCVGRQSADERVADQIASVGNDGRLQLWTIAGRGRATRLIRSQVIPGAPALARVAFAPDGAELDAVGFSKTIYRIRRRGEKRRGDSGDSDSGRSGGASRLVSPTHDLRAIAHDEAGRLYVAGRGGDVHVYPATPDSTPRKPAAAQTTVSVAETRLRTGEESSPSSMDGEIGRPATACRHCRTNPGAINDLAVMPSSGRVVCVCDGGLLSVYDAGRNEVSQRIEIGRGRLFAVEPIDSHRVAVAGSDDAIRIVDLSIGRVVDRWTGHHGSIAELAMADGVMISAGYDATVRKWRIGPTADAGGRR